MSPILITKDKEFNDRVAEYLREANIPFQTGKAIGGVQPDFVIEVPDGRLFVIDTKTWEKEPGFTNWAAKQARLYQEALGADRAFIVVQDLRRNRVSDGVVTAEGLIPALNEELEKAEKPKKKQRQRDVSSKERMIFAAMPFEMEYEDVFFYPMAYAARSVNAKCRRVDKVHFTGDIVEKIKQMIQESIAVIVDLSEAKPNVLYEAGYAHALERPAVHICSTPLEELPFDVSHWNTIKYKLRQIHKLEKPLAEELDAVLPKSSITLPTP